MLDEVENAHLSASAAGQLDSAAGQLLVRKGAAGDKPPPELIKISSDASVKPLTDGDRMDTNNRELQQPGPSNVAQAAAHQHSASNTEREMDVSAGSFTGPREVETGGARFYACDDVDAHLLTEGVHPTHKGVPQMPALPLDNTGWSLPLSYSVGELNMRLVDSYDQHNVEFKIQPAHTVPCDDAKYTEQIEELEKINSLGMGPPLPSHGEADATQVPVRALLLNGSMVRNGDSLKLPPKARQRRQNVLLSKTRVLPVHTTAQRTPPEHFERGSLDDRRSN